MNVYFSLRRYQNNSKKRRCDDSQKNNSNQGGTDINSEQVFDSTLVQNDIKVLIKEEFKSMEMKIINAVLQTEKNLKDYIDNKW